MTCTAHAESEEPGDERMDPLDTSQYLTHSVTRPALEYQWCIIQINPKGTRMDCMN